MMEGVEAAPRIRDHPAKCYNLNQLSRQTIDKKRVIAKQKSAPKKGKPESMVVENMENVFDPSNPYEKILVNQNNKDEDIQCDICLEYEYEDDDQIVMCDLCNAATHQKCYGGSLMYGIPQGNWYCDRCLLLVQNREMPCTDIKCFLCNDIDGMMRNVDV